MDYFIVIILSKNTSNFILLRLIIPEEKFKRDDDVKNDVELFQRYKYDF